MTSLFWPTASFLIAVRQLILTFALLLATVAPAAAQQPGTSPVKIYLLMGESNMEGHGEISPVGTPGTLEYIVANDPGNIYQFLKDGANWLERNDVWMHYERLGTTSPRIGNLQPGYGASTANTTIGPELGFGHKRGDALGNQVLIVKASWGGTNLANDFLPPSSESYPDPRVPGDKGYYYKQTLRVLEDAANKLGTYFPDYNGQGYEIAGICWHQGWNDRVSTSSSAAYQTNMANLIRDLRSSDKGLGVPGLPFVIATVGMDGGTTYTQVEQAQLAMTNATNYPDFAGNVGVIDTRGGTYNGYAYWQPYPGSSPKNENYHWNRSARTYLHIGLAMGDVMSTLTLPRSPSRLRASSGAGGVTLSWQNGTEMPTHVQVLRDGVEIASAAPVSPAIFTDSAALPGVHNYQLVFTMPVNPSDPLTVTHNSGISALTAHRSTGAVTLNWRNNLGYTGIQIQRNGSIIEPALAGGITSYVDTAAPATGIITYHVVPTTGTSTPAQVLIKLGPHTSPGSVIYEPFDFATGASLHGLTSSGFGMTGQWTRTAGSSSNELQVSHPGLAYGTLPVAGNRIRNSTTSSTRAARAMIGNTLVNAGLLADGATLWFSVLVQPVTAANTTSGFGLASGDATYFNSAVNAVGINVQNGSDLEYWSDVGGIYSRASAKDNLAVNVSHLVVGKLVWGVGGANDTFEIFMPDVNLNQGTRKGSLQSINIDQSTLNRIVMYNQGGGITFDEIRFGASYKDVIGQGVGPLDHFDISAIASPQTVGTPITGITLIAQDAANLTIPDFTGTVTFGGSGGFSGTSASFVAGVLTGVSVTPTVAGSNLTLTVNDSSGNAGTATIATIQTQYAAWSGGAAFDQDSNGDGVDDGLDWLLGAADPNESARDKLPVASVSGGNLRLIFRCLKSTKRGSAQLNVQSSSDLGASDPWSSHEAPVPDADATVNGVIFDIADDGDFINVIADIPAAGTKLFSRLQATP